MPVTVRSPNGDVNTHNTSLFLDMDHNYNYSVLYYAFLNIPSFSPIPFFKIKIRHYRLCEALSFNSVHGKTLTKTCLLNNSWHSSSRGLTAGSRKTANALWIPDSSLALASGMTKSVVFTTTY